MSSTETEERTNGQGGNEAEQQGNGQSGSGAMKALKIGALAAAAGTAAYAASKAMTPSDSEDDGEGKNGGGGGGSSRTSMDQIVSAIGNSRWDMLRDLIVPFAESGARSAGAFVASDTPDILSDTLVPKFIEGFVEAKGKKVTSSD